MYMRPGQNRPSPSPSARPASERCRLRLLEGLPALVHDVAHARSICPRTHTLPGATPRHARTAISRACVHLRSRAQAPRAVLGRPRRCHGVLKFDLQGYLFRELRLSRVFDRSEETPFFFQSEINGLKHNRLNKSLVWASGSGGCACPASGRQPLGCGTVDTSPTSCVTARC